MHKSCLQDIFSLKNDCPRCDAKILDGYDACLNAPKVKDNQVTNKVVAAKKKKKSTNISQNLNEELTRQAQQNVALQFGIAGSNFQSAAEESK